MRKGLITSLDSVMTIPGRTVLYNTQYSQVSNDSESQSQNSSRPGYSQQQHSFDRIQYHDSDSQSSQQWEQHTQYKPPRSSHHLVDQPSMEPHRQKHWQKPANRRKNSETERNHPSSINKAFTPCNFRNTKIIPSNGKENSFQEFETKVELEIQKLRADQGILVEKMDDNISMLNRVSSQLDKLSHFLSQPSPKLLMISDRIDSMSQDAVESQKSMMSRLGQLESVQLESRHLLQNMQQLKEKEDSHAPKTMSLAFDETQSGDEVSPIILDRQDDENESEIEAFSQPVLKPQQQRTVGTKPTQTNFKNRKETGSETVQSKKQPLASNVTPIQLSNRLSTYDGNSSDEENEMESIDLMEWMKQKTEQTKKTNQKKNAGKRKQQAIEAPLRQGKRTVITDSCSLFNDSIDVGRKLGYPQEDVQSPPYQASDFQFTTSSLSQGY